MSILSFPYNRRMCMGIQTLLRCEITNHLRLPLSCAPNSLADMGQTLTLHPLGELLDKLCG